MIKKIYKIQKPSDPMTIYIGSTSLDLNERLRLHKSKLLTCLEDWLDDTCYSTSLEEREIPGSEPNTRKQFENIVYEWIIRLKAEGYTVLNYKDGRTDDREHRVEISSNGNSRYKESGQQKIWSDQRHPQYTAWQTKICIAAKKVGLTSKEYREQQGIPDYTGPKKR